MDVCLDYEELFKSLNKHKIKYLVIGAYAVIYYTEPRYTKDIDVWIIPDLNDLEEVYAALADFGVPLKGLSPDDFSDKKMILQIGVEPVRIDILMSISGVTFKGAWKNRKKIRFGKTPIYIIGKNDLIKAKKSAGRLEDKIDLKKLLRKKK